MSARAGLQELFQLASQQLEKAATQAGSEAGQALLNAGDKAPSPGSVDAPVWVIGAAAIAVTLALSASSFLLKPGMQASCRTASCVISET